MAAIVCAFSKRTTGKAIRGQHSSQNPASVQINRKNCWKLIHSSPSERMNPSLQRTFRSERNSDVRKVFNTVRRVNCAGAALIKLRRRFVHEQHLEQRFPSNSASWLIVPWWSFGRPAVARQWFTVWDGQSYVRQVPGNYVCGEQRREYAQHSR